MPPSGGGEVTELLYLAASLAGIALIVALCAFLFAGARATIADERAVAAYLAEILPVFAAAAIAVSRDGTAALAENARDGAIHLMIVRGDGLVVRKLTADLLKKIVRQGDALTLKLADFTLPRSRLVFADDAAAGQWERKLGAVACP